PCLHDEVCAGADIGEYTRPSATLHIFEGSSLVLNRAYTFAPAVYPDTPLNASMGTGSVSKSLTATAVVREMDVQGVSLNTSFAGMIGVAPTYLLNAPLAPANSLTVRVRDVLDNQGGFAGPTETPTSYANHTLIVAGGATAPVDGEELFEYVFVPPPDGHVNLGALQDDTYWQPEWFTADRTMGTMRYSNAGYSLVGELVRVQSGVAYEEYVTSKLLAPLGLEDRVYAYPGPRVRSRGPTRALIGKYLIDARHPYNVAWPNPPQPVQPAVGLAANPVEPWRPYMGPDEPRAPTRATTRYGGNSHLGGAPLAAGGWWADGEALGRLIRSISRTDTLLPQSAAAWMWHPALWNFSHKQAPGWAYVHGWYVRGNWVGWMGGDDGTVALVVHNRMYDITVVFLANGLDSSTNFINPLMASPNLVQGFSQIGQVWPCLPDPSFGPNFTGCKLPVPAVY
ncbi:serine hydrolase domain-containing protein, partial [Enhygromyxa salina]|uniref:serine hydrolase domain-containing protein n=1 Tax=Enhygromyxa salina TaxID=215803 RepID=UPI0011BA57FC